MDAPSCAHIPSFKDPRTVRRDGSADDAQPAKPSDSEEDVDFVDAATAVDANVAKKVALAAHYQPENGTEFCGFRLLQELGRGAFSRVFLAEQSTLAGRYVALKISTEFIGESQTLAQLQHTNIVPIYSVHQRNEYHAICMPYLGSTTLKDVLDGLASDSAAFHSGKSLFETIGARRDSTRLRISSNFVIGTKIGGPRQTASPSTLDHLQKLTFTDSVLWVFAGIARGLQHAHERGILHRDLKPANVLLRDDGEPMLLDFNLSEDTKLANQAAQAAVGGTVPYMSPEHLRLCCGHKVTLDERADIYSIGLMLFECLSGKRPFSLPSGTFREVLQQLLDLRTRFDPPRLRLCNQHVTPAVEAIVARCLAPDPADRYASAQQLLEDIECQLEHRPLRHTKEPSLRERLHKWVRRHPTVTSTTSVAVIASTVVVLLAVSLGWVHREFKQLRAYQALVQFDREESDAQFHLEIREPTDTHLAEGLDAARRGLERYGVLAEGDWMQQSLVSDLPDSDQARLRSDIGEMLQLMCWAEMLHADAEQNNEQAKARLQQAWRLCELAESSYPEGDRPRALVLQKAELLERRGDAKAAQELIAKAAHIPLRTGRDHFLVAREHFLHERFGEAVQACQQAVAVDRQNMRYWFLLGRCYDALGEFDDAVICYTSCSVLRPTYTWAHFNLGLAHYRQREFQKSILAFDEAIRLDPGLEEAFVNRALAKQSVRDFAGAMQDLDHLVQSGTKHTRVYFLRSRLRQRMGDVKGSQEDHAEGLRRTPQDETSWVARGIARMEDEPEQALAEFDQALQLNSRSRSAMQNKARVLSEFLGRPDEAIAVLDRLLKLYPNYPLGRGGRGVLLARQGKREAALRDAEICLKTDRSPDVLYQVACIYSLTSQTNTKDADDALRLLNEALRRGFGRDMFQSDPDLRPIQDTPTFQKLVELAKAHAPNE